MRNIEVRKVSYRHWRCLPVAGNGSSGPPSSAQMFPYSRNDGFTMENTALTKLDPALNGGRTKCFVHVVTGPKGGKTGGVAIGSATCSLSDNFNYETGRMVAAADVIVNLVWGKNSARTKRLAKRVLYSNHALGEKGAWLSDFTLKMLCETRPGSYEQAIDLYEAITNKQWNTGTPV